MGKPERIKKTDLWSDGYNRGCKIWETYYRQAILEIQAENDNEKYRELDKEFIEMFYAAQKKHSLEFLNFKIFEDRQSQLQKMVSEECIKNNWVGDSMQLLEEFWYWIENSKREKDLKWTMERLWMAFVMSFIFNEYWSDGKWVEY